MPYNPAQNPKPFRISDWGAEVRKAWGEAWGEPEVVYQFSNGRKFVDSGEHSGIYDPLDQE